MLIALIPVPLQGSYCLVGVRDMLGDTEDMVVLPMPRVKLGKGGPEGPAGRFVFCWDPGMSPFTAKQQRQLWLCQGPCQQCPSHTNHQQ